MWQIPSSFDDNYEVMVSRNETTSFRNELNNLNVDYKIQIEDVQALILKSRPKKKIRSPRNEKLFNYDQYHNYRQVAC